MTGVRIQIRRDTAANWSNNNPVLAQGEPALEVDTGFQKIGDGSTAWNLLPYENTGGSGGGSLTFIDGGTAGSSATATIDGGTS